MCEALVFKAVYTTMFVAMAVCEGHVCIVYVEHECERACVPLLCVSACARVCVCCRETLWCFLSLLITMEDHTTRCDNAEHSSASGAGFLIDVKTTK